METINLTINQDDIYEEVAQTTSYTGAKIVDNPKAGDKEAYERIFTTDEDKSALKRFWEEAVTVANDRLKSMFVSGSAPSADKYEVTLEVSKSFSKLLTPSIQASLRSYFVMAITGKWFGYANKQEAAEYITGAKIMMEDVLRKLYSRKRPMRPGANKVETIIKPGDLNNSVSTSGN